MMDELQRARLRKLTERSIETFDALVEHAALARIHAEALADEVTAALYSAMIDGANATAHAVAEGGISMPAAFGGTASAALLDDITTCTACPEPHAREAPVLAMAGGLAEKLIVDRIAYIEDHDAPEEPAPPPPNGAS